eukprot:2601016-Pleurochrysis_carterae.AAC.6
MMPLASTLRSRARGGCTTYNTAKQQQQMRREACAEQMAGLGAATVQQELPVTSAVTKARGGTESTCQGGGRSAWACETRRDEGQQSPQGRRKRRSSECRRWHGAHHPRETL